jgi:hypothetical protein
MKDQRMLQDSHQSAIQAGQEMEDIQGEKSGTICLSERHLTVFIAQRLIL